MEKERVSYEEQKQHMLMTIEGEKHRLKTRMKLSEFKANFVPVGSALVMETTHNGLPYYPMQLCNHADKPHQPEDTLGSLEVPHDVIWKKYVINSPEYIDIISSIGKDRLPM